MYSFLFIIAILSSSLYGMKTTIRDEMEQKNNDWNKEFIFKAHKYLKGTYYHQDNVDKCGKLIDLSEETGDGLLMAKLVRICLPPEVVQTYINPYLSEPITTKYKHKLINHTGFKKEYIDHNNTWDLLQQHDGNYSAVPIIGHKYTMWDEHNKSRRNLITVDNKKYITQLISTQNKENIRYRLSVLDTNNLDEQGKHFALFKENKNDITTIKLLSTANPVSHCLFSNDSTLLVIGMSENINLGNVQIYDTKTVNNFGWWLNGSMSALCAAHHTPLFVIGSNKPNTVQRTNLFLFITYDHIQRLDGHNSPITWVEFSPDDTRLLTCSYDQEKEKSEITLWNTSIINKIALITTHTHRQYPIHKAIFICNGEKIMVMQKNGAFCLLDGLTGKNIEKNSLPMLEKRPFANPANQDNIPLIIWSTKYKLIISALDSNILFHSSETNKLLGAEHKLSDIAGIGLTADETTIVFIDTNKKAYKLPIYNAQACDHINFIEKEANIVDLYKMFNGCKKNKPSNTQYSFFSRIKSYIQKHQKKSATK